VPRWQMAFAVAMTVLTHLSYVFYAPYLRVV
jgi:hypothetical protein